MAFRFSSQPHIRAGIHHIIATLLFTCYAMRVSPYIDAVPFITLLFQSGAFFLVVYLLRFSFSLMGDKISALIDISIYAIAAVVYASWHQVFYNFPLESNIKVAFGILLIGSIITIDLAITQARRQQDEPDAFNNNPQIFIPLAVQIGFAVVFYLLSLTMVLSLILSRDLLWISQHASLYLSIDNVNELVRTFLAVTGIFTLYAIIISLNAIALVKRQLAYQVQALDKARQQDFSSKVPMNTLGELSIIAYFTNNMLNDLAHAFEKSNQSAESETKETPEQPKTQKTTESKQSKNNQNIYRDDNFNNDENTVIRNLATLIAGRDGANRAHLMRIQRYVKTLAIQLVAKEAYKSALSFDTISLLYQCAPLYDIGKIAIPDLILKKPGKLTNNQFAIVKTHAQIGADALLVEGESNKFYNMARELALTHHEWWDGSGYPNQLAGEDIPVVGRIMALADTYDALISKRSYRATYDHEAAKEIIIRLNGIQFDPGVVEAFLAAENQFKDINRRYRDELLYTLVS